jgi:hypothetical protein
MANWLEKLFGKFKGAGKTVIKKLKEFFPTIDEVKGNNAIEKVLSFAVQAIPIVNTLDNVLLGNIIPDDVANAVQGLTITAHKVTVSVDELIKDGIRQAAAREELKSTLLETVKSGKVVDLGYRTLSTVEEILKLKKGELNAAIELGKFISDKSLKK